MSVNGPSWHYSAVFTTLPRQATPRIGECVSRADTRMQRVFRHASITYHLSAPNNASALVNVTLHVGVVMVTMVILEASNICNVKE